MCANRRAPSRDAGSAVGDELSRQAIDGALGKLHPPDGVSRLILGAPHAVDGAILLDFAERARVGRAPQAAAAAAGGTDPVVEARTVSRSEIRVVRQSRPRAESFDTGRGRRGTGTLPGKSQPSSARQRQDRGRSGPAQRDAAIAERAVRDLSEPDVELGGQLAAGPGTARRAHRGRPAPPRRPGARTGGSGVGIALVDTGTIELRASCIARCIIASARCPLNVRNWSSAKAMSCASSFQAAITSGVNVTGRRRAGATRLRCGAFLLSRCRTRARCPAGRRPRLSPQGATVGCSQPVRLMRHLHGVVICLLSSRALRRRASSTRRMNRTAPRPNETRRPRPTRRARLDRRPLAMGEMRSAYRRTTNARWIESAPGARRVRARCLPRPVSGPHRWSCTGRSEILRRF